jgi:aminopeptidase N
MRARITSLVLVAAIVCTAVVSSADTYPRQSGVDALHYRFAIVLDESSAHIEGESTATFRLTAVVDAIELDLVGTTLEPGTSAAGRENHATTGMTVSAVKIDGSQTAFTHLANRLRLLVPAGKRAGDEVTYTIAYSGIPAEGLRTFTNLHGERVIFSEGWPNRARHWLPTIDHPYDKATGEMIVTAPAKWQVVSNGLLIEEVDLDRQRRRTHWKQSVPIASWLFALGVARFDAHHAGMVEGVPLQTWSFPQDRVSARLLFEDTSGKALRFFSERIGPYPYEKLANVQASGFGGGMENATAIFYGEKGVSAGRGPVVHEVAHQWFGNSVTEADWDDVWLSEGFATYAALLYREHFEGRDAFVRALQTSRDAVLAESRALADRAVVHRNLADMSAVLNDLVYQKGGWVLHMLRRDVGDDAFWHGLQEYYRRYRDSNATTADLRAVMEQISGRDLQAFFDQWLVRPGHPLLDVTWRYDATRRVVDITLQQTQGGEPYRLPIDVDAVTATGVQRHRLTLDRSSMTVSLPVDSEPSTLVLDPDTWLLADLTIARDR